MSFRSIDLLNVRIWQSAECPFRRTLDVVHHALLFRNLACGQTKFRGHSFVPPKVDEMGYGLRVPLLVISPWAKHGYVSHTVHEASGFITFIEHNFNLGSLGQRDQSADRFADCFDFTQPTAPFVPVTTGTPSGD
jgi:phospholipase C